MKLIPLSQNQFATIDDNDYELIRQHKWFYHGGYAKTNVRRPGLPRRYTTVQMHRLIMDAPPDKWIDHRDGNGLNNTRANLRFATYSENARNRDATKNNKCGYKGVAFRNSDNRWAATIFKDGRNIQLGKMKTAIEAAQLYNVAAILLHGEFARLNNVPPATQDFYNTVRYRLNDAEYRNINNTSGYRGVRWNKRDGNWSVQIHPENTGITIGYYDDKEEAAYIYDQFALQLFGDKAKLNLLKCN